MYLLLQICFFVVFSVSRPFSKEATSCGEMNISVRRKGGGGGVGGRRSECTLSIIYHSVAFEGAWEVYFIEFFENVSILFCFHIFIAYFHCTILLKMSKITCWVHKIC